MPAPEMPRAPVHLAHPSTYIYQPWGDRVAYDSSLTTSIRSYLQTEGVSIVGPFQDPQDFDRASPFADPGPFLERRTEAQFGWQVIQPYDTSQSTKFWSGRGEFAPFFPWNGRIHGLPQSYNQSSTFLGPGTYGDTHSFAWSPVRGLTQDCYLVRDQYFNGFLNAALSISYYDRNQVHFPVGGLDSDGGYFIGAPGRRVGSNAAHVPYAPMLFTWEDGLLGSANHMLPWVMGATSVKQTVYRWPAGHSDGQAVSSPLEYGMCCRLSKDFDFDLIPEITFGVSLTANQLECIKGFLRTWQRHGALLMDVGAVGGSGIVVASSPNYHSYMNQLFSQELISWEDIDFFTIDDYMIDASSMEAT